MAEVDDAVLQEQVDYYRARAPEYDHWWHRTHQYELPPEQQETWEREVAELERLVDGWLDEAAAASDGRRVLEIACGTGVWTGRLASWADHVVAVDPAPEVVAINEAKLVDAGVRDRVEFVLADVFEADLPAASFDVVWFSFWLSHVPPARFDAFWASVGRVLRPNGRAIVIDNKWNDGVWPKVARSTDGPPADPIQVRSDLSSGDRYRIVKVYYEPDELSERLSALGWTPHITATNRFFVAGWATT